MADGMPDGIPEESGYFSLGWEVARWAEQNLAQPDGERAGQPWRWTRSQLNWVVWWYAVDENGRWLYRRGQIVLPKGAGKSPLVAALGCCELAGPVVFDGFGAGGVPIGRPHPSPWVQLAAVSQDQTTNTMSLVIQMLREGLANDNIPGLDTGLSRIFTPGGRLEPVTASAPSREGQRLTAAVLDETHHWLEANGGHRLAATIRRNLAKMGGRSIETTNAWRPGDDSVAERTAEYADKIAEGRVKDPGLLRWHRQAPADTLLGDETSLREGLEYAYGDSHWVDLDRIVAEVYDPATSPEDSRRFYLNAVVTAEDSLVAPPEWDALVSEERIVPGDEIVLGFDGGKTDDATALVAIRIRDRLAQPLGIWEQPDGPEGREWQVDRSVVDGTVRQAMETYKVRAFFADVALWESYIDAWSQDFRRALTVKASAHSAIGRDMRNGLQELTQHNERLLAAIAHGQFSHTGDRTLRRHVLNARRRPNRYGLSFGKDVAKSQRKVDGYAAMMLADLARHRLLESGKYRQKRKTSGRVVVLR
ncbi:terminase [Streptomyces sp. NRRL S-1868]|uniref:terminase n=1 Tax=Streptomyces sp. NRRL S-1868 TaxID=1463892 RepID=UPI000A3DFF65|nr:terminase [Streptomyces sp. NRRL S-1868]